MKRGVLVCLLMLVPAVLVAQDRNAGSQKDQKSTVDLLQNANSFTRYDLGASITPGKTTPAEFAFGQTSATSPGKPKTANQQSDETKRPKTPTSMVGYIDDPIVGSQIRIRFDAGFNDDTPDLAEFFYAKCGCYRGLATAAPPAYDPNSPGPPNGNNIVIPRTLNFQQLYLLAEYAPTSRFSVFAEVPFRWIQAQGLTAGAPGSFPNTGGISDVRAGFKVAVLANSDHSLTAQFRAYFPSGDSMKGLGTNHASIEPMALYYQRITDRAALEAEIGDWHPIGGSSGVPTASSGKFSGDVLTYGIGPSYVAYRGETVRVAPVLELVGWHVFGGLETGTPSDVTGTNIVNLKLGLRTAFGNRSSIYVGFGHKLTKADWYQDIVRVEYRYSF
jgi:hypothetical protein